MLRLMRLEFVKYRLHKQVGISVMLLPLLALIAVFSPVAERMEPSGQSLLFVDYATAFRCLLLMNGSVFILQASVLAVNIVLEEYKGKTVTFLYAYPLHRSSLLQAKAALIMVWTCLAVISSSVLSSFLYVLINEWLQFHDDPVSTALLVQQGFLSILNGLCAAGIALVPFFAAARSKSASATILTALLVISLLGAPLNAGWHGAGDTVAPVLALLGLILGFMAVRHLSAEDVAN